MKKMFISLALAAAAAGAASSANAVTACSGSAGNGATITNATDGSLFVRVAFVAKCSANVVSEYQDQTTTFAVAAGSKKGKNTFVGNTAGGAVKPSGTACSSSGCTETEVTSALAVAAAMASS
jgi:hypothetical protein